MNAAARVLRDLFSTVDNSGFELARALWALGVLAFIVYQGVALLVLRQPFSPMEFGTGFGAVVAGGGIGVGFKDRARAAAQPQGAPE